MKHLLVLLALTIGIFWKLTLSNQYTWLENPDQALQVRPWLDYEARELHAGRVPLWDPYEVGGQSLIAQVQPGLVNPLNWPLFAMPLRDGHIPLGVLHWYWVLIHFVAAAFCYWLCRDLGASSGASVLGGAIFGLAGYIGNTGTPQFLMSCVWIPVILLFFARVFRGEQTLASACWCGAALGAAFLGGHHNVPIYTSVLLFGLWLWFLARNWRERRAWTAAALFAVVAALVSAVQVLPAVEYGRQALRWAGAPEALHWKDRIPYSVHAEYSLHARSIIGFFIPGLSVHANPFVGIVALALALGAVRMCWRKSDMVRLFAIVALAGLLLALGSDTPLHRAAYALLPMVEKARYPAMAIVLCHAGIAALAALGLDARPRNMAWLAGFGIAIIALYGVLPILKHPATGPPVWLIGTVALLLAAVLRWNRALPLVVLCLFLVECWTLPRPIRHKDPPDSLLRPVIDQADIADFLKRQPGWFRVQFDEDAVPYNFGDWQGIEQFGGYTASMPERVQRMFGDPRSPRLFGIEYRVAKQPVAPWIVEVFWSRSGLNVYRAPEIRDPLWAVHDRDCGGADSLHVFSRVSDAMAIDADLACGGRIVAGDPWYTGWRAWVDGRRVRIEEFEGVVRAVPVPAGRHSVEFRYRPGSVYWGAALSVLGLAIAVCVSAITVRRPTRLPVAVTQL
jgi:hypothetical protein